MTGEMISRYPVFIEDEAAGFVGLFVKVVLDAAIFLAGGRNEGDQSRAEFRLLTFSSLHFSDNCEQFGHTVMMIAQGSDSVPALPRTQYTTRGQCEHLTLSDRVI